MKFEIHTPESAPEDSRPLLEQVFQGYGFIPSVYGILAESPAATSAYIHITTQLENHGAMTPQEQQIVMIAVSEQNGCEYCVAAHSTVAGMTQVPQETIAALREGDLPSDPKQAALVQFAKAAVTHRGWIPEAEQQAFLEAGYTTRHVLDVQPSPRRLTPPKSKFLSVTHETLEEAQKEYEALLDLDEIYTASICGVIKSTDYSPTENNKIGDLDRLNQDL